jgi:hypothetical protein
MPRRERGSSFREIDQRDGEALFRKPLRRELGQDFPRDRVRQAVQLLRGMKIETGEPGEEKEGRRRFQRRAPRDRRALTTRKPTLATTVKGAATMSRMDQ